jgi:hypothetical protein
MAKRFLTKILAVLASVYEGLLDKREDAALLKLVKERQNESAVPVTLDDL